MPQSEFEPANTASERSLTHAFDSVATGTGSRLPELDIFHFKHSSIYLLTYLYCATGHCFQGPPIYRFQNLVR